MFSDQQFDRTKRLALRLAGIELFDRHREVLTRRSRRLGVHDAAGLDALLGDAEEGKRAAMEQVLRLVTTKFTGFFRHPCQFEIAAGHVRHIVRLRGRARLWSAAAATGEEPCSLAMALIEAFEGGSPPVSILATDVDEDALAVARRGEYTALALQTVEPERRDRFFSQTGDRRRWAIVPAVRRLIEFRPLNLAGRSFPNLEPFDVIFCRNVLMYLEAYHRYDVLCRLARLLSPEGLLMLDPTEHLGKAAFMFAPRAEGVYRCRREPARTGDRGITVGTTIL